MKSESLGAQVAIIGGGYSGTIAAAELARRGISSLLVEGGGRAGRGTAFATMEPTHLLNVRAEDMSAWAHDPRHFARALEAEGGDARGFAQRRRFGKYVRQILGDALATGLVREVSEGAVSARPRQSGWSIELEGGARAGATALLLAIGNQPPEPLPFAASKRFISNPWDDAANAAVGEVARNGAPVLIIGTGLTMIDMVLSLDAAGHSGRIVALSRRGLIPRSHADFRPAPLEPDEVPHDGVLSLWRWLRRRSVQHGWRAAIDSLRPHSHALWQGLDTSEKRRFLRHARPWWDVHRHRIAPEVAGRIDALIADGRLQVVAGRITEFRDEPHGLAVTIRRRNGGQQADHFEAAFNCTGPLGRMERTADPLLRQMLREGLARPDSLGIGLDVDQDSRVAGAPCAWALGPMTKGRFWEIVAVPDIRMQAAAVADHVARELKHVRRA